MSCDITRGWEQECSSVIIRFVKRKFQNVRVFDAGDAVLREARTDQIPV